MAEKVAKKPNFLVRAGRAIVRFFRDTRGEMKKVVWPSRKQVLNNLAVVLIFVVVAAILVFALDLLFVTLMNASLNLASGAGASASAASGASSVVSSAVSSVVSAA
ncbi:preprotein translocase subunit SecE [Ruminococcaceae bacterium OttesenSCG-928-A16]|nr:preprotein translocase subunit SecE [Ruminococcaceae bacterium OttesenSCG-928-A16]